MPIHAVSKPGISNFCLVTDHSAGQFALNNMILCEDIAEVTLDNLQDLGNAHHFSAHLACLYIPGHLDCCHEVSYPTPLHLC